MKLLRYLPSAANFGDDLNDVLWPNLVPKLFGSDNTSDEAFVGIGTIIGLHPNECRTLNVFTSGAGYASAKRWSDLNVRYHCVRGPLTARFLGLDADRVLTDGAILSPLLPHLTQHCDTSKSEDVIVIPHFETVEFSGWEDACQMAGLQLVDPRGSPEKVISAISQASLVLTESLHGAILADTYNVPWIAFTVSGNFSVAKWSDWASSLELRVEVQVLPPPSAMPLIRFGKPKVPFGQRLSLDLEAALGGMYDHENSQYNRYFIKSQMKRLLETFPIAQKALGYSSERTACALYELQHGKVNLSSAQRRANLREEMLARLEAVERGY